MECPNCSLGGVVPGLRCPNCGKSAPSDGLTPDKSSSEAGLRGTRSISKTDIRHLQKLCESLTGADSDQDQYDRFSQLVFFVEDLSRKASPETIDLSNNELIEVQRKGAERLAAFFSGQVSGTKESNVGHEISLVLDELEQAIKEFELLKPEYDQLTDKQNELLQRQSSINNMESAVRDLRNLEAAAEKGERELPKLVEEGALAAAATISNLSKIAESASNAVEQLLLSVESLKCHFDVNEEILGSIIRARKALAEDLQIPKEFDEAATVSSRLEELQDLLRRYDDHLHESLRNEGQPENNRD